MIVEVIGYVAGLLTTGSLVPEIYRTWKKKEARDLSFYWLGALSAGVALWIVYGVMIASFPVIIANVASLILCAIQIGLAIRYDNLDAKKKKR